MADEKVAHRVEAQRLLDRSEEMAYGEVSMADALRAQAYASLAIADELAALRKLMGSRGPL